MWQTVKAKLALILGAIATFLAVYFIGRRTKNGEVNLQVAEKELQVANQQHDALQKQLTVVKQKQQDILTDILSEQMARGKIPEQTKEMSDDEVDADLRRRGLLK